MTDFAALIGKRLAAVDATGIPVSLTFTFDDGTKLDVDARADWDVGVLDCEIHERGPA